MESLQQMKLCSNATNQLSPVPPSLPVGGAVSTITDYIAISSILPLVLGFRRNWKN